MKVIENPTVGPRGTGSVKVLDDERVLVTITERKGDDQTETNTYEITYPQGVEFVRIANWQLQNVDNVFVQLTADHEDIEYIRPNRGKFNVVFSGFGSDEGKPPTLRYYEPVDWKNEPWLPARIGFFALYEIVAGGEYTGMEILHTLTYEFEWDENLEEFTIVGSTRKKWHEAFMQFLNIFGFDVQHDTLHHPGELQEVGEDENGIQVVVPNVLPELERILKTRGDQLAQVAYRDDGKGWLDDESLEPAPFGMTRQVLEEAMGQQQSAARPKPEPLPADETGYAS